MIASARQGSIMILTMDNPPVNALAHGVRSGLADAIAAAQADPAITAIVIHGGGKMFSGGADITEFTKPPMQPMLPDLCAALDAMEKPVVAAIHGSALGGGLELALSCHYRIATPSAKLGLPEVKLGLLPGAGGTQRLPRVAGVETALGMIVSGDPIGGKQAVAAGLVDRLAGEDSLIADAVAFVQEIAAARPLPRARDRQALADAALFEGFQQVHAKRMKGYEAPFACVEAVKGAVDLPFEEGLALERQLFVKLMFGVQSAALRHIFFAERKAGKIEGLPEGVKPLPIAKVGIIGAGTMGGGIAMNFLSAGIPVTMLEMKQDALDRGVATVRKNYEGNVARGRMKPEQVEAAMALLTPTLAYDALGDADLVIEAVFEQMDVKKQVFAQIDAVAKPGAILASNTSFLDLNEIASATQRPEAVIGLHFFSPANVMKLLEVVRGANTDQQILATAMAVSKTIRKVAVVSGVCWGFIGNRILAARQNEANKLILEGAKPWDVDRVHVDFGMPMGPFQMSDLAGLDIGWHRDAARRESVRDILCAEGRLGQKSEAGFYDYDAKRKPTPSAMVEQVIAGFVADQGIPQRAISDEEILERCLYPMVNEGAKILEEGIAQRASDIDIAWVYGYGWPPYRGGPMFWGDITGLDVIVTGLEKHRERLGPDFAISALLREKAATKGRFN